jgi:hypothetical protein
MLPLAFNIQNHIIILFPQVTPVTVLMIILFPQVAVAVTIKDPMLKAATMLKAAMARPMPKAATIKPMPKAAMTNLALMLEAAMTSPQNLLLR